MSKLGKEITRRLKELNTKLASGRPIVGWRVWRDEQGRLRCKRVVVLGDS